MTRGEAKQRIKEIKRAIKDYDDEVAHAREDALRSDVLRAIAVRARSIGETEIMRLAELALSTDKLKFARWCA